MRSPSDFACGSPRSRSVSHPASRFMAATRAGSSSAASPRPAAARITGSAGACAVSALLPRATSAPLVPARPCRSSIQRRAAAAPDRLTAPIASPPLPVTVIRRPLPSAAAIRSASAPSNFTAPSAAVPPLASCVPSTEMVSGGRRSSCPMNCSVGTVPGPAARSSVSISVGWISFSGASATARQARPLSQPAIQSRNVLVSAGFGGVWLSASACCGTCASGWGATAVWPGCGAAGEVPLPQPARGRRKRQASRGMRCMGRHYRAVPAVETRYCPRQRQEDG